MLRAAEVQREVPLGSACLDLLCPSCPPPQPEGRWWGPTPNELRKSNEGLGVQVAFPVASLTSAKGGTAR